MCVYGQLVFFNESLRLNSAVLAFPVCFCFFIVISFVDGIVFFDYDLSLVKILLSALSTVVIMAGALMLSREKTVMEGVETLAMEKQPLLSA